MSSLTNTRNGDCRLMSRSHRSVLNPPTTAVLAGLLADTNTGTSRPILIFTLHPHADVPRRHLILRRHVVHRRPDFHNRQAKTTTSVSACRRRWWSVSISARWLLTAPVPVTAAASTAGESR
jgi:hypothetical protein